MRRYENIVQSNRSFILDGNIVRKKHCQQSRDMKMNGCHVKQYEQDKGRTRSASKEGDNGNSWNDNESGMRRSNGMRRWCRL